MATNDAGSSDKINLINQIRWQLQAPRQAKEPCGCCANDLLNSFRAKTGVANLQRAVLVIWWESIEVPLAEAKKSGTRHSTLDTSTVVRLSQPFLFFRQSTKPPRKGPQVVSISGSAN